METTTEAGKYYRELTKTEIEIATAQIIDRITRLCKAAKEFDDWLDVDSNESESAADKRKEEIAAKYDIPDGVNFYLDENGLKVAEVQRLKPFVKRWVEGSLYPEEIQDLVFYFSECDEIDFTWAFLEKPSYYYDSGTPPPDWDHDLVVKEWEKLGARSKRKHTGKKFTCGIITSGTEELK